MYNTYIIGVNHEDGRCFGICYNQRRSVFFDYDLLSRTPYVTDGISTDTMLESIDVFISSHESEISSGKFDFSHTRQMEAFEILVEIELMNSEN